MTSLGLICPWKELWIWVKWCPSVQRRASALTVSWDTTVPETEELRTALLPMPPPDYLLLCAGEPIPSICTSFPRFSSSLFLGKLIRKIVEWWAWSSSLVFLASCLRKWAKETLCFSHLALNLRLITHSQLYFCNALSAEHQPSNCWFL